MVIENKIVANWKLKTDDKQKWRFYGTERY